MVGGAAAATSRKMEVAVSVMVTPQPGKRMDGFAVGSSINGGTGKHTDGNGMVRYWR